MIGTLDPRDLWYLVFGVAFLGLTFAPALAHRRWYNLPALYVMVGMGSALLGLPLLSPFGGELELAIIEHASELIVIVSLAGAGLAIETRAGWQRWQATWRLLLITMPLSIAAVVWLGVALGGLTLASAMLLGAALAPTDPVLARSVQVGPPGEAEPPVKVALTAEAGLNDSLAFPFVYLALALAASGATLEGPAFGDWAAGWFGMDVVYRLGTALAVGVGIGKLLTSVVFGRIGDATHGAENPALNFLAWTFIAYGLTEALDGYGFLAVFVAARAGRRRAPPQREVEYARAAHDSGDQLEAILLVVLLLWLGSLVASSLWSLWTWSDLAIALVVILLVRPLAGGVALLGTGLDGPDRARVAAFGVRGMGSIFYIAYGQSHGQFADIEAVWRIAVLAILISIVLHGFGARIWMPRDTGQAERG